MFRIRMYRTIVYASENCVNWIPVKCKADLSVVCLCQVGTHFNLQKVSRMNFTGQCKYSVQNRDQRWLSTGNALPIKLQ